MRINWRAAAAAAGVGFVISVMSGLFGGVVFGTLLFRAVVAAIIVGAGAVVVEYVLHRYLPELFTASEQPPGEGAFNAEGGNVEIVLEEDEYRPDRGSEVSAQAETGREPEAGDVVETVSDDGSGDGEYKAPHLEESLVEEVTEELGSEEPESPGDWEEEPASSGPEKSGAGEGTEDPGGAGRGWELESDNHSDLTDLDTLPDDIDTFSGGFGGGIDSGGGSRRAPAPGGGAEAGSQNQDPSVMAKALQTMLNRDKQRE